MGFAGKGEQALTTPPSTVNDCWSEESEDTVPAEWIGTTRFKVSRTKVAEGLKWANGRTANVQTTTRPVLLKKQRKEEIASEGEETSRLEEARHIKRIVRGFARRRSLPQTDLQRLRKTREMHGSFNAAYSQGGVLRETRIYAKSPLQLGTQTQSQSEKQPTFPETGVAEDKEWHKLKNLPPWSFKEVKPKATGKAFRNTCACCIPRGSLPLEACGFCETPPEVHSKSRALGGQRQGRQRIQSNVRGARRTSFSSGSSKISGYNLQRHSIGVHAIYWRKNAHRYGYDYHPVENRTIAMQLNRRWFLLNETYTVFLWQDCCGKEELETNLKKVPSW